MAVKLLVTDLDGTLLQRNTKVSSENVAAIHKALDKNIEVLIATGRGPSRIDKIYKSLNLASYKLPIICFNGAAIYDFENKSFIRKLLFDLEVSKQIFLLAQKYNIAIWGYSDDNQTVYYTNTFSLTKFFVLKYYRLTSKKFNFANFNDTILKFSFSCSQKKADKFMKALDNLNLKFYKHIFFSTKQKIWDITLENSNKFMAIKWYAEQKNIALENVMAIGDGENDVEMVKNVGTGIAMDNSVKQLKECADFITDKVTKNGLAKAVDKFI